MREVNHGDVIRPPIEDPQAGGRKGTRTQGDGGSGGERAAGRDTASGTTDRTECAYPPGVADGAVTLDFLALWHDHQAVGLYVGKHIGWEILHTFHSDAARAIRLALQDSERYQFVKTLEGQLITMETLKHLGSAVLDQALDDAR